MKKEILITLCVVGLMLFTPFSVVAHENTIVSNLIEEYEVERLVAKIRTKINDKLEKYGSKTKLTIFRDIILFLLELIVRIVKIIVQTIQLIFAIPFAIVVVILMFILWPYYPWGP